MTGPRSKAAREATTILGREAVAHAIANRAAVTAYVFQNPGEVRAAIKAIATHLPDDVPGAWA